MQTWKDIYYIRWFCECKIEFPYILANKFIYKCGALRQRLTPDSKNCDIFISCSTNKKLLGFVWVEDIFSANTGGSDSMKILLRVI